MVSSLPEVISEDIAVEEVCGSLKYEPERWKKQTPRAKPPSTLKLMTPTKTITKQGRTIIQKIKKPISAMKIMVGKRTVNIP